MEDGMNQSRDIALGAAMQLALDVLIHEAKRAAEAGEGQKTHDTFAKATYLAGMMGRAGIPTPVWMLRQFQGQGGTK